MASEEAPQDEPNRIEFASQVFKVQTLVDGGIRVYLDLSAGSILQAAQLMECTKPGVLLRVVAYAEVVNGPGKAIGRRSAKRRDSLSSNIMQ